MGVAAVCRDAISLLPQLEPILGISIALNLAYLNLSKFEYITIVRKRLKDRLDQIDKNVRENIAGTSWCKQITALASVETLDAELISLKNPWINAPGFWGFLYNIFFYLRTGRALAMIGTIYALSLLLLGTGHESGSIKILSCQFDEHNISSHYWFSVFTVAWPIITVIVGQYVCLSAVGFVNYINATLSASPLGSSLCSLMNWSIFPLSRACLRVVIMRFYQNEWRA